MAARTADVSASRTARLLQSGRAKIAKKLAEEAVEVVIDAVDGDKQAVVRESADLLYNLSVLWVATGIRPTDVWKEMERRERLFGIAEKLPKIAEKLPSRLRDGRSPPQGSGARNAALAQALRVVHPASIPLLATHPVALSRISAERHAATPL